jgi:hypothetical protein
VTLYQPPAGTVVGGFPTISPDGQGGAIASWSIQVSSTYSRILSQRVAADASIPAFWPAGGYAVCDSTPSAQTPTSATSLTGSAIVAWDDARGGIYAMRTGLPNLIGTFAPTGWTTPLVAKNFAGNPHGIPSAVLDGNASTTSVDEWFHETVLESGPFATVQTRLELDDESIEDLSFFTPTNTPEQDIPLFDRGPFAVAGGRHTLRQTIDWPNAWVEGNEADNSFEVQSVWSPLLCTPGIATSRGAPPAPGDLPLPNSDGFQFGHNRSTAWVSAIAPLTPNDDYDLYVYSDYSGSQSGFSVVAGSSVYGNNAVDFVVGNRSGTPLTLYPAAVRYSVAGGGGHCAVDQNQAAGRQSSGAYAAWVGQTLGAFRLADVYEADLVAGTTYEFMLRRTMGTSDMLCAVFSPLSGTISGRSGALGTSTLTMPQSRLVYTAATTGPHPIVVFRNMGTGATAPVGYDLIWGNYTNVGVKPTDVPATLELSGAYPNPIRDDTHVRLALPREGEVRLEVIDTAGRRIRELEHGVLAAGRYERSWDARDARGARVGGGVYWLRLRTADQELRRKVVVVP